MVKDWKSLTDIAGTQKMVINRVTLVDQDISIEGEFELPPMAKLGADDQVFVAAFVQSDGSIKEMERLFGVSYPTIKGRLTRIGAQLEFVQTNPPPSQSEILDLLQRGEITADEALARLKP
jgi:hypothetical protein